MIIKKLIESLYMIKYTPFWLSLSGYGDAMHINLATRAYIRDKSVENITPLNGSWIKIP